MRENDIKIRNKMLEILNALIFEIDDDETRSVVYSALYEIYDMIYDDDKTVN